MDSTTSNIWLAVIALASLLQTALLAAGALAAYRALRQLDDRLGRLERDVITPLVTRLTQVTDDVQDVMGRVRTADEGVRQMLHHGVAISATAGRVLQDRVWPAIGLARAVLAAATTLFRRHDPRELTNRRRVSPARTLEGAPYGQP